MKRSAFILAFAVLSSCSRPTPLEAESDGRSEIIGGTPSNAAQDAVVLLVMPEERCTGTLIASNLVLTARHCVASSPASPESDNQCGPYGATISASDVSVILGADAQEGD